MDNQECKECNELVGLYILMSLMCEFLKKDDTTIINNYHSNKHKLFNNK